MTAERLDTAAATPGDGLRALLPPGTPVRLAVADALELVALVRDEGDVGIGVWLRRRRSSGQPTGRLTAAMVALAAMVPDDRSARDLLRWVDAPDMYALERHREEQRQAMVAARTARARDALRRKARTATNLRRLAEGTKPCPACDLTLPLGDFCTDRSRPDGLSSWCRTCSDARRSP